MNAEAMRCWRGECFPACYYPETCSERPDTAPTGDPVTEHATNTDTETLADVLADKYHSEPWTGHSTVAEGCHACADIAEIVAARDAAVRAEAVKVLVDVHWLYFDQDGEPGYDDTTPEPEDVWRYDRDFRAALRAAFPGHEEETK